MGKGTKTPEDTSWRKWRGESPTRRRVRELTAAGASAREIAAALGITTQAVYRQLREIRESS